MALLASGVQLPPDLASTFSGIGTNAYNRIGQNYAKAGTMPTFDPSLGGGTGVTDYQKQRLAATQGLDIGNLEAGLGGELGNTGYQNTLAQRDFNQQKMIADLIGEAAAPSTLQEIFAGIGGGARAATPWAAFMRGRGSSTVPNLTGGGSAYDIMNPGPLDLGYGGF